MSVLGNIFSLPAGFFAAATPLDGSAAASAASLGAADGAASSLTADNLREHLARRVRRCRLP